ncbi:hypothetical protein V8C86DRAFT_2625741 [Haematococcus lacustris]
MLRQQRQLLQGRRCGGGLIACFHSCHPSCTFCPASRSSLLTLGCWLWDLTSGCPYPPSALARSRLRRGGQAHRLWRQQQQERERGAAAQAQPASAWRPWGCTARKSWFTRRSQRQRRKGSSRAPRGRPGLRRGPHNCVGAWMSCSVWPGQVGGPGSTRRRWAWGCCTPVLASCSTSWPGSWLSYHPGSRRRGGAAPARPASSGTAWRKQACMKLPAC